MCQLNNPASCLERGIFFDRFLILASWPDVGDEAVGEYGILLAHICCIKAEILLSILFFWRNHSFFEQNVKRDTVMPIGPADDE